MDNGCPIFASTYLNTKGFRSIRNLGIFVHKSPVASLSGFSGVEKCFLNCDEIILKYTFLLKCTPLFSSHRCVLGIFFFQSVITSPSISSFENSNVTLYVHKNA